ncbi:MAG: hypothetical protein B6I28_03975 [Fusobacteriia bacterium 4572_132]|nr:MAG: hypothetical protein B6I28_03975 [Fusobacteriia bacterium 4572_132]
MEQILLLLLKNFKKIVGTLIGFMVGWFLIHYGILKTLIVIICMIIGYFSEIIMTNNWKKKIIDKLTKKGEM